MIRKVNDVGCLTLTSFYAYCFMVAGSIHALFLSQDDKTLHPTSQELYDDTVKALQKLSTFWKSASFAVCNLFHSVH